jgi:hypothetical protein
MPDRFREVGDKHAGLASHVFGIEPLLELFAKQVTDAGLGDLPIRPTTRRCLASRCACSRAAPSVRPAKTPDRLINPGTRESWGRAHTACSPDIPRTTEQSR